MSAPPTILVPPVTAEWQDIPLTPGTWRYVRDGSGSVAAFGPAGLPAIAELRCDPARRVVTLIRFGASGALTIRTSYGERSFPAEAPAPGRSTARWPAADPFLDRIAFSRGRISVAAAAVPILYLPAWAEPARVIEDCRS